MHLNLHLAHHHFWKCWILSCLITLWQIQKKKKKYHQSYLWNIHSLLKVIVMFDANGSTMEVTWTKVHGGSYKYTVTRHDINIDEIRIKQWFCIHMYSTETLLSKSLHHHHHHTPRPLHFILVHLPPPPPSLLPPSPVTAHPSLSLSLPLLGHSRSLHPISQTFGCHRRCLWLLFDSSTPPNPERLRWRRRWLVGVWAGEEEINRECVPACTYVYVCDRKREWEEGKSGGSGTNQHHNEPLLTEIEWISQSILSANEIRDMVRDGVVPLAEPAGERPAGRGDGAGDRGQY